MQRSWLVFSALGLLLGGCASSLSGDSYSRGEARHDSILVSGALTGITTIAAKPTTAAARATPCAWLPADA
ncbi:MAG TPA: hypothetical protein VFH22_06440, partial [Rhodocyclaceae bacterium]|nr:hypothetical protein [Rhodocyclaceae bacterium]